MVDRLTHVGTAGAAFLVLAGVVAAQESTAVPMQPAPVWLRYAFFGPFAFALAAGGLLLGAGFRNKTVYSLIRGTIGVALGAGVLYQFMPGWLVIVAPLAAAMVLVGYMRYIRLVNDRTTPGPGWQWSWPPRRRRVRYFNLRAGVWEAEMGGGSVEW
jgi:uncharacterized membrane protein HdeD (DUF308 family)